MKRTTPEYGIKIRDHLTDLPTHEELRHVVAFLPEIYQDYIQFLADQERNDYGDSGALRPSLNGTAGGE